MKKHFYILLLSILVLSGFSSSTNRTTMAIPDTRAIYKALFIYNFATLVDWPAEYRKGDFNIGIYGADDNVFTELNKKYSGKAIGSQEIKVKKINSKSEISAKTHILFLANDKSGEISSLNSSIGGKSTLLITEKDGYLSKGSVINFVIDSNNNNKQSYEINKNNAKKHKLVIASKLSSLAVKVIE